MAGQKSFDDNPLFYIGGVAAFFGVTICFCLLMALADEFGDQRFVDNPFHGLREKMTATEPKRWTPGDGLEAMHTCHECNRPIHDEPRAWGTDRGELILCRECSEKFLSRKLRDNPGRPKTDAIRRKGKRLGE